MVARVAGASGAEVAGVPHPDAARHVEALVDRPRAGVFLAPLHESQRRPDTVPPHRAVALRAGRRSKDVGHATSHNVRSARSRIRRSVVRRAREPR